MNQQYYKYLIKHCVIWTLAFTFFVFLRQHGQEVDDPFGELIVWEYLRLITSVGVIAGLLFGSFDYLVDTYVMKKLPFGQVMILGFVSYLLLVMLFVMFGMIIFTKIVGQDFSLQIYINYIRSGDSLSAMAYCIVIGFMIDFVKQVDKKLGPGNLWKMLKGEFYSPKEEDRIFMFLDLKSSTSIAENLGHIKYSRMIQDCFNDLDIAVEYDAEIYQYVGDEVVLTWRSKKGLKDSKSVEAYFAIVDRLFSRRDYYEREYGVVPVFKAGMNIGKVTVAEVGNIKSEIAYHGDAINTAARIQDQCNELQSHLLISEDLYIRLNGKGEFIHEKAGEVLLRGKQESINVYSVIRESSLS